MRHIQKDRKLNIGKSKGFTLVEMIVVLVMISIVTTLAVFGILAWQDWSDFNRENEYAETLFVAAQNQLAEFSANGRLQELKASLYGYDSIEEYKIANEDPDVELKIGNGRPTGAIELSFDKLHQITSPSGVSYNEANIWPEAYSQENNQVNYTDVIVSLRAESGQYERYLNNPEQFKKEDLDAYWLFEILGDYVYDTSILNGGDNGKVAICLEITISNGQVFSALYSDKNDYFRYMEFEGKRETGEKCGDISNRSETVRQDNMVGYYGVDSLYAATPTDIERPGISSIALINDNYFYLKMRLSERYRIDTANYDYTIDLNASTNQDDKVMTIKISHGQLKGVGDSCTSLAQSAEYALVNNGTVSANVTLYEDDGKTPKSEGKNYQFIAWVDKDYYIHLILDAADMQAQTNLYKGELSSILEGTGKPGFDNTFSYFRFGAPIKDLWASAYVEGEGVSRSKTVSNFGNTNLTKNQSATNPVYQAKRDYVESGILRVTYDISNPRHMYNIRYNSDLDLADRKLREDFKYKSNDYSIENIDSINYVLKNDIDWYSFQREGYLMNGLEEAKGNMTSIAYPGIDRKNCDYPSYAKLNLKDAIEGNNFTITGLSISKTANRKYRTTIDISPTMKAEGSYLSSVSNNCPTGFVNINYGSMQNLKLDNIRVTGDSMVGAFAGVNVGEIKRLTTVRNTESYVNGVKNVGGIIGFEVPTSEETEILFCENNIAITGQEAVGGIVGMVRNEFSNIIVGKEPGDSPILEGVWDSAELLKLLNTKEGIDKLSIKINHCDNYGPVQGEYKQMYEITGKKVDASSADSSFVIADTTIVANTKNEFFIEITNNSSKELTVKSIVIELKNALEKSGSDNGGAAVSISADKKKITLIPKAGDGVIAAKGKGEIQFDIHFKEKDDKNFIIKKITIEYENDESSAYGSGNIPSFVDPDVASGGSGESNIVKEVAPVDGDATNVRYFGGIVGYCYNQFTVPSKINIIDCTSCPQYEESWLFDVLSDSEKLDKYLNGYYVGGIVGYNHFGEIDVCSSKSNKVAHGYIFGNEYVGGIVGLNIGPASGVAGGTSIQQGGNANHVIANSYAGGIVGCNANVQNVDSLGNSLIDIESGELISDPEKLQGLLLPDTTTSLNVKIDNWLNESVVIARNSYSGGITGYNAGWIFNCNTKITEADANKYFDKIYTYSYSGGIAGYNNGVIGNTNRELLEGGKKSTKITVNGVEKGTELAIRSYVRGHNYVGGVVGYNDVDAIVENYKVSGGYVLGEKDGSYVGGYVGLNASIDLLMDTETKEPRSIKSNPNRVEGGYFVGGIIGGNIINTNGYPPTLSGAADSIPNTLSGAVTPETVSINALFETDNFLGTLSGEAYVGGFVGYSMLVDDKNVKDQIASLPDGNRGLVYLLQNSVVNKFEKINKSELSEELKFHERTLYLDNLQSNFVNDAENKLSEGSRIDSNISIYMTGENGHTRNSLGTISAKIYVGGVAGYVDENTALYVYKVENATPIVATSAIEYKEQQPLYILQEDGSYQKSENEYRSLNYAGMPFTYTYSYAGGIVGKVGIKTVIDECSNVSLGRVTSEGTYTGGLCEVNEGIIKKCKVTNLGNGSTDYVGGLCGLNLSRIMDCQALNQTITGRNMVGAIVAENFGTIENITLDGAKIMAYNNSVSHNDAEGNMFNSLDGVSGLFAAYNGNTGIISLENDIRNVTVQSKGRYVGLAVGFNEGSISNNKAGVSTPDLSPRSKSEYVSFCSNNLTISGIIEGYQTVGALIGCNNDGNPNNKVYNYTNLATVRASHGEAGGIIGVNSSKNTIVYCENSALVVSTDGGNAGGITSINDGVITRCFDYNAVSAPNGMCGGIVAKNDKNGNIYDCYVEPGDFASNPAAMITFASTQVVGGLAAQNAGTISGNYLKNIIIKNDISKMDTKMGAMVGENLETGKILLLDSSKISAENKAEIDNCKLIVESNNCKVGGIAGTNAGTISGNAVKTSDKAKKTIGDYQITSLVTCDIELKSAAYASMGGVTGVNTGDIKNISVDAKIKGNLGTDDSGYGGIAGVSGSIKSGSERKASITYCTFDGEISAEGSSGMLARVGGIVGINGKNSDIQYCGIGVIDGDSSESKLTLISAGDLSKDNSVDGTDRQSNSYTGGIAGENYGYITDIDAVNSSKDAVNIIAFAGSTGGIAGHNCIGASITGYVDNKGKSNEKIHRVTTGEKWYVDMRCAENNRGPGGIIGLNESGKSIEYVDNYAHVRGSYKANMKTGGFIGENMQIESNQLHIANCNNFALVEGWANTGGFIGHDWYRGAVFDNCRNYGPVRIIETSTAEQRFAAGFIGRITAVETGFSFVNCENHGNIWCNTGGGDKQGTAGGFIGQADELPTKIVSYMTNCVNTGLISRENGDLRLTANFIGYCKSKWDLNMCRNYNTTKTIGGFCAKSDGSPEVNIHNSLDVSLQQSGAGKTVPFAGVYSNDNTKSVNNYYIAESPYTTNASIRYLKSSYSSEDPMRVGYMYGDSSIMSLKINDPLGEDDIYINDKVEVSTSRNGVTNKVAYVSWDDNDNADIYSDVKDSRISVYKELDANYVDYIMRSTKSDEALSAPVNVEIYTEKGLIKLKWDGVTTTISNNKATPYGYEIYYKIYDKEGNSVLEKSEIQAAENIAKEIWHNPISIEKEWIQGNYRIEFKVKAISGYHYMIDGDDSLDSAWSKITESSKYTFSGNVLIMPEAHIELTAGNKMVAILDNLDEYQEQIVMVKDENGNLVSKPMSEVCEIKASLNSGSATADDGKGYNFTIDPEKTIVSNEARYIPDEAARRLRVSAVPKEEYKENLVESEQYFSYGKAHVNGVLIGSNSYSTDTFYGFYGEDPTTMVYQIGMSGGDDSYLTTDIGAYDDTVGAFVYYGRDLTHVGSSAGGSLNAISTLKNLPLSWFDENTEPSIEARVYLDSSQSKIIRYGHDVKTGITLYSESASMNATEAREKNVEILKSIKDPYHLAKVNDDKLEESKDDFLETEVGIWDEANHDLNYGYILYHNEDGTYDIVYNATIELSRRYADEYTKQHANDAAENNKYSFEVARKYYKYDVDVLVYANRTTTEVDRTITLSNVTEVIPKSVSVNMADYNESYRLRRQANEKDPRYNQVAYDNTSLNYNQNIMPAPIADKDPEGNAITISEVNGKKVYSLAWDKFYRDSFTDPLGNYVEGVHVNDKGVEFPFLAMYENNEVYQADDGSFWYVNNSNSPYFKNNYDGLHYKYTTTPKSTTCNSEEAKFIEDAEAGNDKFILWNNKIYYTTTDDAFFSVEKSKFYKCNTTPTSELVYYNGNWYYLDIPGGENAVFNEADGNFYIDGKKVSKKTASSANTSSPTVCDKLIATNSLQKWWLYATDTGEFGYNLTDLQYLSLAGQTFTDANGNEVTLRDFDTWKAFRERTGLYDDYIQYLLTVTKDNDRKTYCMKMMNAYYFNYFRAAYKVEFIGITDSGDEVVLDTKYVSEPTKDEDYYQKYVLLYPNSTTIKTRYTKYETWNYTTSFEDSDGSWEKYKKLSARITRLGQDRTIKGNDKKDKNIQGYTNRIGNETYDKSGLYTVMLPRYSTVVAVQHQRLDTVETPDAVMTMIDGQFVTEYPAYDISWMLNRDSEQLKDLAGYLLKIEDASEQDPVPSTYYYISENDSFKPDFKSLLISDNEMEYLLENVTEIEASRDSEKHTDRVSINFVDYSGRDVKVTVRAISREESAGDSRLYFNGYESTAKEIKIKESLAAPDVDLVKLAVGDSYKVNDRVIIAADDEKAGMPDYTNAKSVLGKDDSDGDNEIYNAVTSDIYEKGFTFNYAAGKDEAISANYAGDGKLDVKLNMAIAIYDSVDEDMMKDSSRIKAGDASAGVDDCWNSGALTTLYTKGEPFSYGYIRINDEADTEINLSLKEFENYTGSYAGKWMKIAIQATSETNIDSLWSDEDVAGKTVNYLWIHIPKLILKDVDISAGSMTRWYHEKEVSGTEYEVVVDLKEDDQSEPFVNRALTFADDQNADGWHIGVYMKAPNTLFDDLLASPGEISALSVMESEDELEETVSDDKVITVEETVSDDKVTHTEETVSDDKVIPVDETVSDDKVTHDDETVSDDKVTVTEETGPEAAEEPETTTDSEIETKPETTTESESESETGSETKSEDAAEKEVQEEVTEPEEVTETKEEADAETESEEIPFEALTLDGAEGDDGGADPIAMKQFYELYFDRHYKDGVFDGTWDVYIAAGNGGATVSANAAKEGYSCSQNGEAVFLGNIGTCNVNKSVTFEEQYIGIEDISYDFVIGGNKYHIYAGLYYNATTKEFSLILPDVAGFDESDNYFAVEQVVVEKIVDSENERYVEGVSGIFDRHEKEDEEGVFEYKVEDMYVSDVKKWFDKMREAK